MIVVTGAAGLIGSNVVRALNARGIVDIVAVDNLTRADKFRNLVDCDIADYLDKEDFLDRFVAGDFDDAEAVLHQGACSDTMGTDGRYMMANNYRYTLDLLDCCVDAGVRLIYASSAAVYGASPVFVEDRAHEAPLNVYGWSKCLLDHVVRRRLASFGTQVVGLRYFNVYGPREAHKARMASVAFHAFNQFRADGCVRLFEGSGGWAAGEQRRDFISVDDVARVNLWFLDHPEVSGIFNCGTGRAQPFNDVAVAVVNALRAHAGESALTLDQMVSRALVEYTAFPPGLRDRYQSYTQADLAALRGAGCDVAFDDVATGVARYVDWLVAQTH